MRDVDSIKKQIQAHRLKAGNRTIPKELWPPIVRLTQKLPARSVSSALGISYTNLQRRMARPGPKAQVRKKMSFAKLPPGDLPADRKVALEIAVGQNTLIKVFA
jgi:hypothetical protein